MTVIDRIKLSMHSSSSKHFAKEVGRSVDDIEKDQHKLQEYEQRINEAIKSGDAVSLKKDFVEFIKICGHEVEEIEHGNESEFIIEHRLIKKMRKAADELSSLESKGVLHNLESVKGATEVTKSIRGAIAMLHHLNDKIIISLKKSKMRSRDLKNNHEYMRDRNILPQKVLYELLHVQGKTQEHYAHDVESKAEKFFNDVHKVIELLHEPTEKGEHFAIKEVKKLLDHISHSLEDFDSVILKEFEQAAKIEQELIVVAFRLFHLNEEELKKLDELMSQGLPAEIVTEIKQAEQDFIRHWQHEEEEDYRYTKELFHEGKTVE